MNFYVSRVQAGACSFFFGGRECKLVGIVLVLLGSMSGVAR